MADGSATGGGGPARRTHTAHIEQRSHMEHTADGLVFRAQCSCGWLSQPVSAERVVELWERHHRAARRALPTDPPAVLLTPGVLGDFRTRFLQGVEGPRRLEVVGEVDMETSVQLERIVTGVLRTEDLHLDLRLVTFIDSTGLGVLIAAKQFAAASERNLDIEVSATVKRLIELTGLADALLG